MNVTVNCGDMLINRFVGVSIRGEAGRKSMAKILEDLPKVSDPTITIKMPVCGAYQVYTQDSFPKETTPCPCGDPTHFLVEYTQ